MSLMLESWQWFLAILSIIPLLYWYFTYNLDYWRKRGVNGPKPIPIFGNSYEFLLRTPYETRFDWHKKYGKIIGIFSGHKPVISITDPDLIKVMLVRDFHLFRDRTKQKVSHPVLGKNLVSLRGDDWKRIRSIASPTFSSGKMRKMYPLIKTCINDFLDALEPYAKEGKEVDMKEMNGKYTMDVIAKCAFATQTNSHKDNQSLFIRHAKSFFNVNLWKLAMILFLPAYMLKMVGIQSLNDEESIQFFINTARHIIRKRRINNEKHNDFLQLLMDAERNVNEVRDENDADEAHHVNEGEDELAAEKQILNNNVGEKKLSEVEILAQAVIFFLAGYETTASTLSYCYYALALNPDVQETLYNELKSTADENGDIPYETLAKLKYLDAVISETLRLFPPALILTREANAEYKLGDTGITLYKGQSIEIPINVLHHSEQFYTNPLQFNPQRFMPENRDRIVPYSYLPFGAGPHNCIGMRFALMEAKLALAKIVQTYKFIPTSSTEIPLSYKKNLALLQAKNIIVGIEKRS